MGGVAVIGVVDGFGEAAGVIDGDDSGCVNGSLCEPCFVGGCQCGSSLCLPCDLSSCGGSSGCQCSGSLCLPCPCEWLSVRQMFVRRKLVRQMFVRRKLVRQMFVRQMLVRQMLVRQMFLIIVHRLFSNTGDSYAPMSQALPRGLVVPSWVF